MAISAPHYRLLLEHRELFPRGGSLLEIGEANWYGDIDPRVLLADGDAETQAAVKSGDGFAIAKALYRQLFAPSVMHAIDNDGTAKAFKFDLNGYVRLPQRYDVVMNHGTAEHIFNIGMVFKTMHDACKPGGIMTHESPFTGWIDHGFYTLQPTLFYDLAAANDYDVISVSVTEIKSRQVMRLESRDDVAKYADVIPNNAMLYVVLRKGGATDFVAPWQGFYGRKLSQAGEAAWRELR